MPAKKDVVLSLFEFVGIIFIFLAIATCMLFVLNVRAHLLYGGPYQHLEWVVAYFLLTGLCAWRKNRWAVLLLFLPGVVIALAAFRNGDFGILPLVWCVALLAVPVTMCARWKALPWA